MKITTTRAMMLGLLILAGGTCVHVQAAGGPDHAALAQLARAMRDKDQAAVERLASELIDKLGDNAGKPEPPDEFRPFAPNPGTLPQADISTAFDAWFARLARPREQWWTRRPAPTELPGPLRQVAGVITGTLAARRAGCRQGDHLLAIARGAGEYLLWAQAQGGRGVFPIPDLRGKDGRVPELIKRFLARAEREGVLNKVLAGGWIVDDQGGGDLQFDNGLCGVAMLELYTTTHETKYLESARAAAEWAMVCPIVANWNYNAFSVFLLAEMARATKEERYLAAAKEKARLGIYPGQLAAGPYAGRWADPHNARIPYHYILCRGLGALLATMPKGDPDRQGCRAVLERALTARNQEILKNGVANPETVMETLARLAHWFPPESGALGDCGRAAVMELLGSYGREGMAHGKLVVPPNAWGLYLEAVAGKH